MAISGLERELGQTKLGTWTIKHLVAPVDRWSFRVRGKPISGRGLGSICLLTTRGRRTGKPRTTPMFYVRDGDNLVVCNVNPGYERTNPWVLNLRSEPLATVQISGEQQSYHAREASAKEIERLWPLLVATWPAYQAFYGRSGQRAIFILEPVAR